MDRSATPEKLSGAVIGPQASAALKDKAQQAAAQRVTPIDPLEVAIDGIPLRMLLIQDERGRQERGAYWKHEAGTWTPAQRAAVSAHWSAELRAKVAAGQAAALQSERHRITCDPRDPIDLED